METADYWITSINSDNFLVAKVKLFIFLQKE